MIKIPTDGYIKIFLECFSNFGFLFYISIAEVLQSPSHVAAASTRMLQQTQALRGPPLTPQYFIPSHVSMAPIMAPAAMSAPSPQSHIPHGTYLVPSAPLTGKQNVVLFGVMWEI